MATAFATNSSNFTQRKNKGFSSQSLRQKHNGEFTGCENMEISPDKIQEYLDSEKMVPASQMERRVLRETQNLQGNLNVDHVTKVKKEKSKEKSFYNVAKSKLAQQIMGKKTKSKSKKSTLFNVLNPEPSAILDDDLLCMDIDMLDPSTKIREMFIKRPDDVVDIYAHLNDQFNCPEYAQEVYCYLQSVERRLTFSDDYLASDPEVTPQMRAILTDWLIQVQVHEELCQQTIHLTVALIDRFLVLKGVKLQLLQLLGITCLFIAAKYVERFPPEVATLCHLTDNSFQPAQVLKLEIHVLKALNFDLNITDPTVFLDRFLEIETNQNKEIAHMSQYLLDLSLTEARFTVYQSSIMAASAMYLSRKLTDIDDPWNPTLAYYSRYSEKDLAACTKAYSKSLLKLPTSKFQGAKNKYNSMTNFDGISNHPALQNKDLLKEIAGEETLIM